MEEKDKKAPYTVKLRKDVKCREVIPQTYFLFYVFVKEISPPKHFSKDEICWR